jgi:hypothetical protein
MEEKTKLEGVFTSVYQENRWGGDSSVSGPGSSLEQTSVIRENIIELLNKYNIKTIVDAPCGDFFWMKEVLRRNINYIDSYTGIDIVEDLIRNNKRKYGSEKIFFIKSDLTKDLVPKADLILCRDCFLHLSYKNICKILNNFKLSGADYLLTSTYTRHINKNVYKFSVEGRAINLEFHPFKIEDILVTINENYHGQNEEYNDKSLILIRLGSIDLKRISRRVIINEMVFFPRFVLFGFVKRVYFKIIRSIRSV